MIPLALLAVLVSAFYPYGNALAHTVSASKGLQPGLFGPHFLYQNAVKFGSTTPPLPCLSSSTPPRCYSPQQIRRAYGIQSLLEDGITGKGRTIVIVDAFQSPTIRSDLQLFDLIFGLPDPSLNIIASFGLTRSIASVRVLLAHEHFMTSRRATIHLASGSQTAPSSRFQDLMLALVGTLPQV